MADVAQKTIRRLLIANRGEIARRIMRTARAMGMSTVAVYADSDAHAPFVKEADTAIALRGSASTETYLDVEKILAACRKTGADALHPGYGFLSENAVFAEAVTAAGISWVGPSPDAIRAMGDKLSAKRLMQKADVPTLPAQELKRSENAAAAAKKVGYPLLIKASAGGGGRGMRIVREPGELEAALASARREAAAAFGDDTVFIERYLAVSRHVEIQILGDRHGNLVHCFERECSIQRRHQKIIEEAPSPAMNPDLRTRMGEAAVAAGRAIGYASAGTVEFLLDGDDFWFLEVNTRLQVEHPVTEEITGLDLVREQLRIAEGERLGYTQADLTISGHAIEARLYAEDPRTDFLPTPGHVAIWAPSTAATARFDSGVESGSEIGIEFDPMMAKVIVHAPTRREAVLRLARVLETTRIHGLTTNRDFLVATLRTPEFLAGDTTTDFIDRVKPPRSRTISRDELHEALIGIVIEAQARRHATATVLTTIPSGWRNSVMPPQQTRFRHGEEETTVTYERKRGGVFKVRIDDAEFEVMPFLAGEGKLDLDIDGQRLGATIDRRDAHWFFSGSHGDITIEELPRFVLPGAKDFQGGMTAPMPGKVVETFVAVGDTVEKGQLLVILEAMKMEHRITAPVAGTVDAVHVTAGEQVANGQVLIMLNESSAQ
jgi:propionyl-CoA carboxylase alpha chain